MSERKSIREVVQGGKELAGMKVDMVKEREAADVARMKEIRRMAMESDDMWLDASDLGLGVGAPTRGRQQLNEEIPLDQVLLPDELAQLEVFRRQNQGQNNPLGSRPKSVKERLLERGSVTRQLPQRQQAQPRQMLMEEEVEEEVIDRGWKIRRYIGETKKGESIPVFKVVNPAMNLEHGKLFRIEEVAQRIVMILNESNNFNDPRVVSLINSYDKRDKLIKEMRALEKSAEGKAIKTERLKQIRSEVAQLDYKLGI